MGLNQKVTQNKQHPSVYMQKYLFCPTLFEQENKSNHFYCHMITAHVP